MLERIGAIGVPVRRPEELAAVDGLIIPGGESTVMDKLSRQRSVLPARSSSASHPGCPSTAPALGSS